MTQLGAWLVSGAVLGGLLMLQSARAWPHSVWLAAVVSFWLAALQYVGLSANFSPWIAAAEPGEMLANLRQRNQFASLMALGWLAALALLAQRAHAQRGELMPGTAKTQLSLLLICGLVAMLGLGNALSGSRTGLLQWLAVLALVLVWRRSLGAGWRHVASAAVLGYVLGVIAAPWLADWLGHGNAGLLGRANDTNAFSRIALWSNVLELIAREPLLGHGWRSLAYAHYSSDFCSVRFMELLDNAHNLPLHVAVELGLPVAIAFCGGVAWMVWRNKPWAEESVKGRPDRQLAWGALMVIGIHSLLEYPLWYGPFFMTVVICVAVLCADTWKKWLLARTQSTQFAIILGMRGLGLLLLAGTAFVAFDYHRVSQIYLAADERSSWYAADPLGAAKKSVLFQSHAKFAELQITPLSKETAPRVLALSSELVHWSPEPRIIEKLIESSVMMGLDDIAAFHLQRYRVNYPAAYADWQRRAQ